MKPKYRVFQDTWSSDLILVSKVKNVYRVERGFFRQNGFRPCEFLGSSIATIESNIFNRFYSYVGKF